MSNIDHGGFFCSLVCPNGECQNTEIEHGITLRDWFAGMAMMGIISGSNGGRDSMHPTTALEVARNAYHFADIMLKVRKDETISTLGTAPHEIMKTAAEATK